MRYGSFASSIVTLSSPIADAIVSIPTGPPLNPFMIVVSISRSSFSRPSLSTPRASSALLVISILIFPGIAKVNSNRRL
jgi:hypothetical protein